MHALPHVLSTDNQHINLVLKLIASQKMQNMTCHLIIKSAGLDHEVKQEKHSMDEPCL